MARKIISYWDSIVEESNKGVAIWVGVDVHKRSYSVAILSANGVRHSFRSVSDNQALLDQFSSRCINIALLVYEAGPTGFGLARACQAAGVAVMVVAPNRIPRGVSVKAKSDAIDCIELATLASKGMLRPIAIPTQEQEAKRGLSRRRTQLAKSIRSTKQRIKSFILCHGLGEPQGLQHWSKHGLCQLSEQSMPELLRFRLDSLLRELEFLQKEKAQLEATIKRTILPEDDVLQSVPGVGPIISAAFRSEVFASQRFSGGEQLSSYLGLAPCVRQSGSTKARGSIMPSGQSTLRGLLVEACWILKRTEKWALDFYNRIRQRTGNFQQAITALARKLAILLWRLLIDNRPYQSDYQRSCA